MTTYRVARRTRYTSIDRRSINERRLSFRARGVLVWILDKPDGWEFNAEALAEHGTEGRDAMRTALAELRQAGYIVTTKTRMMNGRWSSSTEVFEHPSLAPPAENDPSVQSGKPALVSHGGFPGPIEKTENEDCYEGVVEPDLADSDRDARQGDEFVCDRNWRRHG